MGFLSRIFGFRNAVVVVANPTALSATPDPSTLPAVVRAVQLIAADVARLPIRIETAEGELVDSPLLSLLNRDISRWQSAYEFKRYVTGNALLDGNGIAIIRRDAQGAVVELQPVPTGAVKCTMTDEGIEYRIGSSVLSSDQVLHIGCYPDPLDPIWFISPLDAADFAMRLSADQEAVHSSLVKTGGKVAIRHPGALADESVEAIRDAYQTQHATPEGANRPLILREGMTAETLGSNRVADNLNSRQFSVQEVARAFGVPPEMLFHGGSGALATAPLDEMARQYANGALAQWTTAWESELTRKLCAPGEFVRFDMRPIARGSLKDQGQAWSKLVLAGIATPNDARQAIGLPPLAGLDVAAVSMPGGMSGIPADPEGQAND